MLCKDPRKKDQSWTTSRTTRIYDKKTTPEDAHSHGTAESRNRTPHRAMSESIKTLIASDKMRNQFAKALPAHLSPDRFARVAITALTKTPKLKSCTQASLMKCLLDLSAAGLEPDGRRAYLIPYGTEATVIISYMGLIELMRRSGDVTSIMAETVCEADDFSWRNGEVSHEVDWRAPRGELQAVYAVARLKNGETQTAVMTREEVDKIRKRSRSGKSGPWLTDFEEMAKKTVVRRLSKMLPLSSEIMEHITQDDTQFTRTAPTNPFAKDALAEDDAIEINRKEAASE